MAKNLEELRDAVRARGLRVTPSRIAVLEVVRASDAPMSHGDVAEHLTGQPWDRATIYRNLVDLAEAGLLRRTDVGDHVWRFEAIADEHDSAHPHFVCTECGAVECLPELELSFRRAKTPRAVKQRQIEVHVRGLCDACI
jgi:Fur family transcriptional regulator, ferric uptake regulator